MLTILTGGFYSSADGAMKQRIREHIEKKERAFLIVPEQETVDREAEMAELLPSDYPLYFELTNFTRFANSIFRTLGGLAGEAADGVRRALLMWRTLVRLSNSTPSEINHARVLRALDGVKEMQSLGITPTELTAAAEALNSDSNRGLIDKARELSEIMTLYKNALCEKFKSGEDEVAQLAEKLDEIPQGLLSGTHIYISGFTSFTEPQYRVMERLMRAASLTVVLCLPHSAEDAFEYTEPRAARARLTELARRASVEVRVKRCDALRQDIPPLLADACRSIWRINTKIDNDYLQDSDTIRVFKAETPYDECDFIASDIKRRVMAGASFSDFGIVAKDISSYIGILDSALEKVGIPVFISRGSDTGEYEAIKLIYTAISSVISGFERRDVITYAKCGISGVSREAVDEFELYCNTWQINKRRFFEGGAFNMNPDGYTVTRAEGIDERLRRINETKEAVISPLLSLDGALRAANTVKDFSLAVYSFISSLGMEEGILRIAKIREAAGDGEGARSLLRLYPVIISSLDTLCDTLGDEHIDTRGYLNLLRIVFSSSVISRIPSTRDEVSAGSADIARMHGKRHIYMIGANFGVFPATVSEDSHFSDRDRKILGSLGLPIEPDKQLRAARELFYFSRAMSYAEETLTVSYSAKNTSFAKILPSFAVERLSEISGGALSPRSVSDIPILERIYSPEQAAEHTYTPKEYENIKSALISTRREGLIELYEASATADYTSLDGASIDELYPRALALTQSRIDVYVGCPMNYFCKYNLKLKENKRAEFGANNIGSFVHAVLEGFFKTLKQRGRSVKDLTDGEKSELARRAAEEYIGACFEGGGGMSARMSANIERLVRASRPVIDNLCEEFSSSDFEPMFFELDISNKNPKNPSPLRFKSTDGHEVYIYGVIDRVDTFSTDDKVYVRVVDYKTGSKSFSPDDFKAGRNLQMFLYLKSVIESDSPDFKERLGADSREVIPAGIIYVKTDVSGGSVAKNDGALVQTEVASKQKRIGMILDDDVSIAAMNKDFLPVKPGKNGEIKKDGKTVYTMETFDEYDKTIGEVIGKISDNILSGNITATPSKDACHFCEFRAFCRKGAEKGRF